jgi:CxxC motif-containing protein (DUF1111 family)
LAAVVSNMPLRPDNPDHTATRPAGSAGRPGRTIARIALLAAIAALGAGTLALAIDPSPRPDLDATDLARVKAVTRPATQFEAAEPFEARSAGAATVDSRGDANAFSLPSANLDFAGQQQFLLGNGLFRKDWVSAPSSTQASDGLGPLFNARSCQGCHIKDGRGHAPLEPNDSATSLLVRASIAPDEKEAALIAAGRLLAVPDPVYGSQIQDGAVAGLAPEARIAITYTPETIALAGGETATLRRPALALTDLGYGPLAAGTRLSARIAPQMIGLGLIEAIADGDILAQADPDDADGDGISGRPNFSRSADGTMLLGRFGWKAIQPSVFAQSAHAFAGDMGLSTPLLPDHFGDCTLAQSACRAMPHGAQPRLGAEEVPGDLLDLVAFYSRNLAVPMRRAVDEPDVLAGKALFYQSGCTGCHTPKYVTRRDAGHPAQRFQLIWPYADFLLHDMGPGLADSHAEGLAEGAEWRTPPLWGIGLAETVSAEAGYLHDGRAPTLIEAILWHDGEARPSRDKVVAMTPAERAQLVRFLESL